MDVEIVRITDGFGQVRQIGRRVGDTLYTVREFKKHYFRIYSGWGIDADVLRLRNDIQTYILLDIENNIEYIASREMILNKGKKANHPGHGEQYVLPLKDWDKYEVSK